MKISDLAFVLNKLNENGYGDVELYTHWEDYKGKPKYPEFHIHLNGMNGDDFKRIWQQNPFPPGIELQTFSISKESSIVERNLKISACFDVWNSCMETRKYMGVEDAVL